MDCLSISSLSESLVSVSVSMSCSVSGGWWEVRVGGCEGVIVGGDVGNWKAGLMPWICPRFLSSACIKYV